MNIVKSAFEVQQQLWKRYEKKRDEIIERYGKSSPIATRKISYAWIAYRQRLRTQGIVATDAGWVYKEEI